MLGDAVVGEMCELITEITRVVFFKADSYIAFLIEVNRQWVPISHDHPLANVEL